MATAMVTPACDPEFPHVGGVSLVGRDLVQRALVIPGERMKDRRDFVLPLSEEAVEVLGSIEQRGEFVFGERPDRGFSGDQTILANTALAPDDIGLAPILSKSQFGSFWPGAVVSLSIDDVCCRISGTMVEPETESAEGRRQ